MYLNTTIYITLMDYEISWLFFFLFPRKYENIQIMKAVFIKYINEELSNWITESIRKNTKTSYNIKAFFLKMNINFRQCKKNTKKYNKKYHLHGTCTKLTELYYNILPRAYEAVTVDIKITC